MTQVQTAGAGGASRMPIVRGGTREHHFLGDMQDLSQFQNKLPGLECIQNTEQPKPTGSEALFPVGKPTCDRNPAVDTDGPETQSVRQAMGGVEKAGLSGRLDWACFRPGPRDLRQVLNLCRFM